MSDKKPKECYNKLIQRITAMESSIDKLMECVEQLQTEHIGEEVCADEIAADRAAHKAIGEICIGALFDVKSKGDA